VPLCSHLDGPDPSGLHLDSHGPLRARRRPWSETGRWTPTVSSLDSGYSRYASPIPHTPIPTLCVLNSHIPFLSPHPVLILPSLHVRYVAPRRPLFSLWPLSSLPSEPGFANDHVPSSKLGHMEGKVFHTLIDCQSQGTGMCYHRQGPGLQVSFSVREADPGLKRSQGR